MNAIDWTQIGVGVAAVLALIFVARTMRGLMKDVFAFLGNHMSENTRAQQETARALERVATRLEGVEDEISRASRNGTS